MARPLPGQVRIIGGSLRGSKLPVVDRPGLRPTSDRARETLFNWLQQEVAGRRVLDLFAGSGALGFEAASRGAAEVLLLERDPALAQVLRDNATRLKTPQVRVEAVDALAWLSRTPDRRVDLAFVDPPFAAGLWTRVAAALSPWLADDARVYVELARDAEFAAPAGWTLHREGTGRETRHLLFRTMPAGPAATLAGESLGTGRTEP